MGILPIGYIAGRSFSYEEVYPRCTRRGASPSGTPLAQIKSCARGRNTRYTSPHAIEVRRHTWSLSTENIVRRPLQTWLASSTWSARCSEPCWRVARVTRTCSVVRAERARPPWPVCWPRRSCASKARGICPTARASNASALPRANTPTCTSWTPPRARA